MSARTRGDVVARIALLGRLYPLTPGITAASDRTLALVDDGIPGPSLYPSEDGLLAEWDIGAWSISVEFCADTIEGCAVNTTTHADTDFAIPSDCDRPTLAAAVQAMFDIARAAP